MSSDRRSWLRFQTVLPVVIESTDHGAQRCVARNVSCGGLCVELAEPLPLGSEVIVWFMTPDGARIGASGVVKNHYVFNYWTDRIPRQLRGMGVRFLSFDGVGEQRLASSLDRLTAVLQ